MKSRLRVSMARLSIAAALGLTALGGASCKALEPWYLSGNDGTSAVDDFLGTTDRAPLVCRVDDTIGWRLLPTGPAGVGTPAVVGGAVDNSVADDTDGALVAGGGDPTNPNSVLDDFSAVLGGAGNRAGDGAGTAEDRAFSVVRGGAEVQATGYAATAAGRSTVSSASYSAVLGGWRNGARGWGTTIGGGRGNVVEADFGTLVGGSANETTTGTAAVVLGGTGNSVLFESQGCTVVGGLTNGAGGYSSTVGGGLSNAAHGGDYSTVHGGLDNATSAYGGSIGGGQENLVTVEQQEVMAATIGGGRNGLVTAAYVTVAGGRENGARARLATIGGGAGNDVFVPDAGTIAGGSDNVITGSAGTVLGGANNEAGNWYGYPSVAATAAGGAGNMARGAYTLAAGRFAGMEPEIPTDVIHPGCFLWNDTGEIMQDRWLNCQPENAFRVRAAGGVMLFYGPEGSRQVVLEAGSGDWSFATARTALRSIHRVDDAQALRTLASLPVSRWRYRQEPDDAHHMGPMAQDFGAAFEVGADPRRIGGLDADGATLAAIRGLLEEVEAMERVLRGRKEEGSGRNRIPQSAGVAIGGGDSGVADLADWLVAGTAAGFALGGLRRRAGLRRRPSRGSRLGGAAAIAAAVALGVWLAPGRVSAQPCWNTYGNSGTDPAVDFVGTTDDEVFVLRTFNQTAFRVEPGGTGGTGTPNVVGGTEKNLVDYGAQGAAICGGGTAELRNVVQDDFGVIGGGAGNLVGDGVGTEAGQFATVCGGRGNAASGTGAAICGGEENTAGFPDATVGGGFGNSAIGEGAVVAGGVGNAASEMFAAVCGGYTNQALTAYSVIGGGQDNAAYGGDYASVCGGYHNWAMAEGATVGGGTENYAMGHAATVAGGTGNQAGGVGAEAATVGGGINNTASGAYSTIGGGEACEAFGDYATIAGGEGNKAQWAYSTVGGGRANEVGNEFATVAGGQSNVAVGKGATVGGGQSNQANADYSTVPGGSQNVAGGQYSFAAGRNAHASERGCFVWGDSTDAEVACMEPDQFVARASGGFYFYTSPDLSTGVWLPPDGSDWLRLSDRESKRDIEPVDPEEVLRKLRDVPIYTWSYTDQPGDTRHMGPMAQDFHAAFGLGTDERYLGTLDPDGVAMAALQGLERRVERLRTQLAALDRSDDESRASTATTSAGGSSSGRRDLWAWLCGLGLMAGLVVRRANDRRRGSGQESTGEPGDGGPVRTC